MSGWVFPARLHQGLGEEASFSRGNCLQIQGEPWMHFSTLREAEREPTLSLPGEVACVSQTLTVLGTSASGEADWAQVVSMGLSAEHPPTPVLRRPSRGEAGAPDPAEWPLQRHGTAGSSPARAAFGRAEPPLGVPTGRSGHR